MLEFRPHPLFTALLTFAVLWLPALSLAQSTLRIEQFARLPDGQAELVLTGATSPMYTVEATTNLIDWTTRARSVPPAA
jgi:hypothetical protein